MSKQRIITSILFFLSACTLQSQQSTTQIPPTPTTQHSAISNESTEVWEEIDTGLSWRTITPENNTFAQMRVLKIDPQQYDFRAVYQPQNPLTLSEWQAQLPDAIAIINANFFDPNNQALGIVVSDGLRHGIPFRNTGGTFVVENGEPIIYSNQPQPYNGNNIQQAIEGFPMLVQNGQAAYFDNRQSRATRRTLIAKDTQGNVLIMATPFLGLSLAELSAYLPTTDLNIVTALNLDGGGSTMMSVQPEDYAITSFDPVPTVLAIYKN